MGWVSLLIIGLVISYLRPSENELICRVVSSVEICEVSAVFIASRFWNTRILVNVFVNKALSGLYVFYLGRYIVRKISIFFVMLQK